MHADELNRYIIGTSAEHRMDSKELARKIGEEARNCAERGAVSEAQDHVLQALALAPGDVATLYLCGKACLEIGDTDKARELFLGAVRLDPTYPFPAFELGELARNGGGDVVEAIGWYQKATSASPEWWVPDWHLASAQAALGQFDDAIACLEGLAQRDTPVSAKAEDEILALVQAKDRARLRRRFVAWLRTRDRASEPYGTPPKGWERVDVVCAESHPGSSAAFDEIAETLAIGLHDLGCIVDLKYGIPTSTEGVRIVLAPHLLAIGREEMRLPPSTVLVNFEQMATSWSGQNTRYHRLLRRHPVWDYSPRNLHAMRRNGHPNLCQFRLGYVPELSRIPRDRDKDIDVLFFGSINERRARILDEIQRRGLRVERLYGVYGPMRDEYIARSRMVINIHFYDDHIFEVARCFYLFANGVPVVTELEADTEIEPDLRQMVAGGSYGMLPDICEKLIADPDALMELGRKGLRAFAERRQSILLAATIASTELAWTQTGQDHSAG